MKGYKAMNEDMTCRGFRYEIGKTYEFDGNIQICKKGFHFCRNIASVFRYYERLESRVFEVEASGAIAEDPIGEKLCCQKIRIVREVKGIELNRIIYGNGYGDGNGYGNGYGDGYGDGDGYGYGNGYGYGSGYGDGYGYGDGNGYGDGYGYGDGDGYGNGNGKNIQIILEFMED